MKRVILFLFGVIISCFVCGQTSDSRSQPQLQLHSFKELRSEGDLPNLYASFKKDWPVDNNGGDGFRALIRVKFENMPIYDCWDVSLKAGHDQYPFEPGDRTEQENRLKNQGERWFFVNSIEETYIEVQSGKYGTSNRLQIKLESDKNEKAVYTVKLKNDKTISISVTTNPPGAKVRLGTGQSGETGETPATLPGVMLGKNTITISLNGQTIVKDSVVDVSEDNVHFDFDLRPRKEVRFTSDPDKATLYIDGKERGTTPQTLTLPYGNYKIVAEKNGETDEKNITIDSLSSDKIKMELVKYKSFTVRALQDGRVVEADLYVDGKIEGSGEKSYTLKKVLGKSYTVRMLYGGNDNERRIKVTDDMDEVLDFKIKENRRIVWPWERSYEPAPVGFAVGYVPKQWKTTDRGDFAFKEDVWGNNDKLNGLRVGLHFQPCFSWGLGLYTGVFYEFYYSSKTLTEEERNDTDHFYYNKFYEHSLYVPIHIFFRIPFSRTVALYVHGGLGMDCGIRAYRTSEYEYAAPNYDYYGEQFFPKRFNFSADIGLGVRIGSIMLHADFSKGVFDHAMYTLDDGTALKTTQNKFSIGLSYMFSDI